MSQENEEIARQGTEAFNRHDVEAFQALFSADAELVTLRAALEGTSYRGPDAVAEAFRDFDESWEELHFDVEEVRSAGDHVVEIARLRGRGRASGVDVEMPLALLLEFRAGKIAYFRAYIEVADALEAAGLSE